MYSQNIARNYSTEPVGTSWLAFRDLDSLLLPVEGKIALDYGCGRGRSTRFLTERGFDVLGIDIAKPMIEEAKRSHSGGEYRCVEPMATMLEPAHYDLILSSLLLFDITDKKTLRYILDVQYQALKPGGLLIHTAGSDYLLKKNWLSVGTNFPENQAIQSGQAGRVILKHRQLELTSWYWSESEMKTSFMEAGFKITTCLHPLGHDSDPYAWEDEAKLPPYVIYGLTK